MADAKQGRGRQARRGKTEDYTSFSRDGLIDQLVFEGDTCETVATPSENEPNLENLHQGVFKCLLAREHLCH